jgi:hypothetical protein
LQIYPQNDSLVVGVNRLGVALLDNNKQGILGAKMSIDVVGDGGRFETVQMEYIGNQYANIPVYLGAVRFPRAGNFKLQASIIANRASYSSQATATVLAKSVEVNTGDNVPSVTQAICKDAACGNIAQIDSGVPPDSFHNATIADGLTQKKPMIIYLGEPGRCPSLTCGPTVQILQQLASATDAKNKVTYGSEFLIEHIEVHSPASANTVNPALQPFGIPCDAQGNCDEPWVYFVNANGVISDRYEGPVTLIQLEQSADGTLAGKVPAVDVTTG